MVKKEKIIYINRCILNTSVFHRLFNRAKDTADQLFKQYLSSVYY